MGMKPSITRSIAHKGGSLVVRLVAMAVALLLAATVIRVNVMVPYVRDGLTRLASDHQLALVRHMGVAVGAAVGIRLDAIGRIAQAVPPPSADSAGIDGAMAGAAARRIAAIFSWSGGGASGPGHGRGGLSASGRAADTE